jgi:hypothetical protein
MLTRPTWPAFVVAFIGALGVLVLLAPQSVATKAQSNAVEMQTVGQAGAPINILPANRRVAVGDRSAD